MSASPNAFEQRTCFLAAPHKLPPQLLSVPKTCPTSSSIFPVYKPCCLARSTAAVAVALAFSAISLALPAISAKGAFVASGGGGGGVGRIVSVGELGCSLGDTGGRDAVDCVIVSEDEDWGSRGIGEEGRGVVLEAVRDGACSILIIAGLAKTICPVDGCANVMSPIPDDSLPRDDSTRVTLSCSKMYR